MDETIKNYTKETKIKPTVSDKILASFKKPKLVITPKYMLKYFTEENMYIFENVEIIIFSIVLESIYSLCKDKNKKNSARGYEVLNFLDNNRKLFKILPIMSFYNYDYGQDSKKDTYSLDEAIIKNILLLKSKNKSYDYILTVESKELMFLCADLDLYALINNSTIVVQNPNTYFNNLYYNKRKTLNICDTSYVSKVITNCSETFEIEFLNSKSQNVILRSSMDELSPWINLKYLSKLMSSNCTSISPSPSRENVFFSNPDTLLILYALKFKSLGYKVCIKSNDTQMNFDSIVHDIQAIPHLKQFCDKEELLKKPLCDESIEEKLNNEIVNEKIADKKSNLESVKTYKTVKFKEIKGEYYVDIYSNICVFDDLVNKNLQKPVKINGKKYYKIKINALVYFINELNSIYRVISFTGTDNLILDCKI